MSKVDIIERNMDGRSLQIGIVVSRFNEYAGKELYEACLAELKRLGVEEDCITKVTVPGALETPLALAKLAGTGEYDALIALGAVIKGETYHFELVADRSMLESVYSPKTRAMIITNPNNPTGTILNDKDMRVIIDFALSHNLYIICDEVYREICFTGEKVTSILKYPDVKDNVIVIDSVSKRFSCCGARIGALISKNEQIVQNSIKLAQARLSVSTLNQIGAAAMYNNTMPNYFESIKNKYQSRVDVVVNELNKIKGVKVSRPNGAFYIMATLPLDDAEDFQKFLLEEFSDNGETVMFAPASNFYEGEGEGKNEIRLAAVLNEDRLRRAIELLGLGLVAYKKAH